MSHPTLVLIAYSNIIKPDHVHKFMQHVQTLLSSVEFKELTLKQYVEYLDDLSSTQQRRPDWLRRLPQKTRLVQAILFDEPELWGYQGELQKIIIEFTRFSQQHHEFLPGTFIVGVSAEKKLFLENIKSVIPREALPFLDEHLSSRFFSVAENMESGEVLQAAMQTLPEAISLQHLFHEKEERPLSLLSRSRSFFSQKIYNAGAHIHQKSTDLLIVAGLMLAVTAYLVENDWSSSAGLKAFSVLMLVGGILKGAYALYTKAERGLMSQLESSKLQLQRLCQGIELRSDNMMNSSLEALTTLKQMFSVVTQLIEIFQRETRSAGRELHETNDVFRQSMRQTSTALVDLLAQAQKEAHQFGQVNSQTMATLQKTMGQLRGDISNALSQTNTSVNSALNSATSTLSWGLTQFLQTVDRGESDLYRVAEKAADRAGRSADRLVDGVVDAAHKDHFRPQAEVRANATICTLL